MKQFPSRVEDLSPELLTSVLAERQSGVRIEQLEILETSPCGDGRASTADRVALRVDYAPGCDEGLPERFLLKTMLLRPHAPEAMYRNEVRFYSDIREELSIEAPRAFGGLFDAETGQFGILMEDLTLRGARFPNATTPVSQSELSGLVEGLATLHAHYWNSPRFKTDLAWVATPCSGGMYPIFRDIGLELIRDQVDKSELKQQLLAPLGRSLDEMWEDLWKLQAILESEPVTLLHGDPHIGNTYLLPDGAGGLLDWQLMVRGRFAHDLTYLLVSAQTTQDRRSYERDLIEHYLGVLRGRGVEAAPDFDSAWLLYRQSVVWGLMIGWLITPPTNYGEAITGANLERQVAAIQDLETFAALSS